MFVDEAAGSINVARSPRRYVRGVIAEEVSNLARAD